MGESQDLWLQRQAIELLAQHLPFETDPSVKAACIEELRKLVLHAGDSIDRAQFGFAARLELQRLKLWHHFRDSRTPRQQILDDDDITYGHVRPPPGADHYD
ncbi:MAG: hypothetical protein H0X24_06965 [Ktedonobacterales bacterium]|nr:hypothetical protein [Ktedonobacterales bacterium]